ncbi:L-seryl-tRNA(Sec) selenium transferase [Pseudoruegeria sp. HB172150]|uniref:L-seryl-tRNA(Sec) selenium transferase n=1 Tax=Pseudoruegeria sp. HB172150 TaxID=2721164 RepID=UPI001553CDFE|nr:L-seryl-tRNA(Sec) selenium transferase [Pseudoruegeria sp. HB172150]
MGSAESKTKIPADARRLPSVDKVLQSPVGQALRERYGHTVTADAIRDALNAARLERAAIATVADISATASAALELAHKPRLTSVFNLTGTVLHTNLGRAQLADCAIDAAIEAMRNAVALEFDIDSGGRGERDNILRDLLCELTGAEDATVVNNNASAVLLTLNTLAFGRKAIVSRGELIEIGGAFRMPEIMASAGTQLVEVGTTNRTHKSDYLNAIDSETGVVMKVHTSNYRIEGFTAEVPTSEVAAIAREMGVPMVDDLGSGTLIDLAPYGVAPEATVRQAVDAGADVVTFSGDKLLGGPQAGFIVGRKDLIAQLNANPMKRALRADKIRIAAIEATLRLYRKTECLAETLPTYRFLARSEDEIRAAAQRLAPLVGETLGSEYRVTIADCRSQIGSGAMPVETLPSAALAIKPLTEGGRAPELLAESLRQLPKPVIGRIARQTVLLDLRCLKSEADFLANLAAWRSPQVPK